MPQLFRFVFNYSAQLEFSNYPTHRAGCININVADRLFESVFSELKALSACNNFINELGLNG